MSLTTLFKKQSTSVCHLSRASLSEDACSSESSAMPPLGKGVIVWFIIMHCLSKRMRRHCQKRYGLLANRKKGIKGGAGFIGERCGNDARGEGGEFNVNG